MTPWISRGSLFPHWNASFNKFPDYHGPFAVGTIDVEVPTADLASPCHAEPEDAQPTISFRIFYPCAKQSEREHERPVKWIQQPQKEQVRALAEFLGVGQKTSWLGATLLRHLYWIDLPAHRNAKILEPETTEGRWPVTMFSHGLAGNRNSYSFICGNLASYGTVVIAPDHRDGSSPLQHVRATTTTEARTLRYIKYSHEPTKEVYEGRDKMLRIRMWEIACIYEALLKIDRGDKVNNLDPNTSWDTRAHNEVLQQFKGMLDLHRPGKVTWAGHSFGAATTVQLLKSIFYAARRPKDAKASLITTAPEANIAKQITADSPTLLLDLWNLPLLSPDQAWLKDLPLPSYALNGQEGNNVLAVLSEAFYKWRANMEATKHVVAPPSESMNSSLADEKKNHLLRHARLRDASPGDSGYASSNVSASASRTHSPSDTSAIKRQKGPHVFYPECSQHFSQSDFGILFPWITSKMTKTEEPENILKLNTRAMVQVMREAGIEVAGAGEWDDAILSREPGTERRWIAVPIDDAEVGDTATADDDKLEVVDRKLEQHSPEARMPDDPSVAAIQGN